MKLFVCVASLLCFATAQSSAPGVRKVFVKGWNEMAFINTTCTSTSQLVQNINVALGRSANDYGVIQEPSTNRNATKPHVQCSNNLLELTLFKNDNDPVTEDRETDRSRLELHSLPGRTDLSASVNETWAYAWWFRLGSNLKVGDRFFHIFQLKARPKEGNPVITLQLKKDGLYLYQQTATSTPTYTKLAKLSEILNKWIKVYIEVVYKPNKNGSIMVMLSDQARNFIYNKRSFGLTFPDTKETQTIYAKWGLYRGLSDVYNAYDSQLLSSIQILRKL